MVASPPLKRLVQFSARPGFSFSLFLDSTLSSFSRFPLSHHDPACVASSSRIGITALLGFTCHCTRSCLWRSAFSFILSICDCVAPGPSHARVLSPSSPLSPLNTFHLELRPSSRGTRIPEIEEFTRNIRTSDLSQQKAFRTSREKKKVLSLRFLFFVCLGGRRCPTECGRSRAFKHSLVRDDIRNPTLEPWLTPSLTSGRYIRPCLEILELPKRSYFDPG